MLNSFEPDVVLVRLEKAVSRWRYDWINRCFLALAVLIFCIGFSRLWGFTVDDSFISYRYAESFAHGHGLSWNYDGVPVYGFSNYLLVLMTALGIKFGVDPVLCGKAIGLATGILSLVLVGQILRRTTQNRFPLYYAASLAWACIPAGWVHAASGMETMLFACLILLSVHAYLSYIKTPGSLALVWLVLVLMLTILCRFEGATLTLGIFIHRLYALIREPRRFRDERGLLFALLLPFVFLVGLMCWNRFYFGQILPNPFYVKSIKSVGAYVQNVYEIVKFLAFLAPFLILVLVELKQGFVRSAYGYLILQMAVFLAPFMLIDQQMNYLYRFYYPVASLSVIAAMGALAARRERGERLGLSCLLAGCLVLYPLSNTFEACGFGLQYGRDLQGSHIAIGKALGRYPQFKDCTVAVVIDAGAVPYYSHWKALDMHLNDAYTAHHGFEPDYFFKAKPDVIVMTLRAALDPVVVGAVSKMAVVDKIIANGNAWSVTRGLLTHPEFLNYSLVTIFTSELNSCQYVFVRDSSSERLKDVVLELKKNSNCPGWACPQYRTGSI